MFKVAIRTPSTGITRFCWGLSLAKLVAYFASERIFENEPQSKCSTNDHIHLDYIISCRRHC
jgi:hypothetical protein